MFNHLRPFLLLLTFLGSASAQQAQLPEAPEPQTVRQLPLAIVRDQLAFVTSPARLHTRDLVWIAPLALATGAAIATDHRAMVSVVSRDPGFNQANVNASNGLVYSLVAVPAGLYGAGFVRHSDSMRESGLIGAEALGDGIIVEQAIKLVFWRERPTQDAARGRFSQGSAGPDSSFPSSHSVVAWSAAAAIAGRYPSPLVEAGVYSAATAVSLTRVLGQQHFPSDVLIGSAAGYLIGRYVTHRHPGGLRR